MVEPVTPQQLADHLRLGDITGTTDDLSSLIEMARDLAERYTGRAIIRQQILHTLDALPGMPEPWWDGVREGVERRKVSGAISLPRAAPLVTVDRFTTYDNDNSGVDADLSIFNVDKSDPDRLGRIVLRNGQVWPIYLRSSSGIEILYTCGWLPQTTPPGLKRAILVMAAWMYANRGDCDGCLDACGATAALAPFRLIRV